MATASLSREEKLQLLAALEEKKRREKLSRPRFSDRASPQQLEVLECDDAERYVFAGNGGGKTALGSEDLRCHVLGVNPYTKKSFQVPTRAYVVLDKPEKFEQVIIPELLKWMNLRPDQLHKKGKPYISLITLDNGSWIRPLFWDQEPMTAEGIEADYVWFDEPPPRALYIALKRGGRTRGRRAKYLFTGTPLAAPWLRTEVYEPWTRGERVGTSCFRFGTECNRQNLAEGYIESFSAVLSERERLIRLQGEFFDLEGMALAHLFNEHTHVLPAGFEWDPSWPTVVAIDPHPSKKHMAVLVGADRDNRLYVLKELARKETPRQFAKTLSDWMKGYRIIDIVCDSLGSADMTGGEGFKSFIQVLNEEGVRARATTFLEKEDEAFISRIQDALLVPDVPDNFGQRIPKLRFSRNVPMSVSDVRQVQWVRDKRIEENKPKLDISNKDALACIKYALATNLYYAKPAKTKAHYVVQNPYLKRERANLNLRSNVQSKRRKGAADDDW
jgi:hypothetical protein